LRNNFYISKKAKILKKFAFLFLLSIFIISCKTQSNIVTSKDEAIKKGIYNTKKSKKSAGKLNYELVDFATENLGVKYRYGGTTKAGMDCSGLVFTTFNNFDISLPRTSAAMATQGEKISIKKAQVGDLIFFKTNGSKNINHVGIITEVLNDSIKFIHSSTQKGVIISSTAEAYYDKSFAQINRVIN